MPMLRQPRRLKRTPRKDVRFNLSFWGVILITSLCLGFSYFSCATEAARNALNETLLTVFKLGCGALIALLGRLGR